VTEQQPEKQTDTYLWCGASRQSFHWLGLGLGLGFEPCSLGLSLGLD